MKYFLYNTHIDEKYALEKHYPTFGTIWYKDLQIQFSLTEYV